MGKHRDTNDSDWAGVGDGNRRAAFESGVASLALGGLLLLAAPVQLIANMILSRWVGETMSDGDLRLYTLAAWVVVAGILAVGVLALSFGVRGVRRAWWYDQPAAVPVAGILVSALAILGWAVVGYNLIATLNHFSS